MDETAKITDLIWHVDSRVLLSLYIWEVDDDGQRGEAENNIRRAIRNRETAETERTEAGSKEST